MTKIGIRTIVEVEESCLNGKVDPKRGRFKAKGAGWEGGDDGSAQVAGADLMLSVRACVVNSKASAKAQVSEVEWLRPKLKGEEMRRRCVSRPASPFCLKLNTSSTE